MAFDGRWNSISYDGGGLHLFGSGGRFVVTWGDGAQTVVDPTDDDSQDGVLDAADTFHFYGSDGTYDVLAKETHSGLPAEHFRAFMYSSETSDLTIGGTRFDDIVSTGSGNDTVGGGGGDDFLDGASGNDRLVGGDGGDVLFGDDGDDRMLGGEGDDYYMDGGKGDDRIDGGAGDDGVHGQAGNDILIGGAGNDYIQGDAGLDRLTGGSGSDTFVISQPRDADGNLIDAPDPNRDIVTDFIQGEDRFAFDQWGNQPFDFRGQGAFTGTGHAELRFGFSAGGDTIVFGDADGDKGVDFSVKIEGHVMLTAADFGF